MFENFGISSPENKGKVIPEDGTEIEKSKIPEFLDDPRLGLDGIPEGPDLERDDFENPDDLSDEKEDIAAETVPAINFNNRKELEKFIHEKFNDEEDRATEKINRERLENDTRLMQIKAGHRLQEGYELNRIHKEKILEINKRDAQRIKDIVAYIRNNRTSTGGIKNINVFWNNFKDIFDEEIKTRTGKNGPRRQERRLWGCKYHSAERIQDGILGEIAARDLLEGLEDYFSDPENEERGYERIDFTKIRISVEDTTMEEDVIDRTDLKLNIVYEDMEFVLPVQVKCSYIKESQADSSGAKFMEDMPFILARHGIGTYEPYGEDIGEFFRKHKDWGGLFMPVMHGCKGRKIGNDGFPNQEIRLPFNEAAKREIYDFLIYQISQRGSRGRR